MGSKSSSKAHTPVTAADTLQSAQRARIVDLLGWGELDWANGNLLQSVYLDDTPVQDSNGKNNFDGVDIVATSGCSDQSYLYGFNGVERYNGVGAQVKHGSPITRTIEDATIDRLRITVGVNALYDVKDNGDTVGTSVSLTVKVGSKRYQVNLSNQKTTSSFYQDLLVDNLPKVPFDISVIRDTADSDRSSLKNDTYFSSYVGIVDAKLSYPNCAVVGLRVDSSKFGESVPKRTYAVKNVSMKYPSNYHPETRAYDGVWDGTFTTGFTDNPAWCFYNLLLNKRYGLGSEITEANVDKWSLYTIARYCDQLVDDGYGNLEPRMTCNAYIDNQSDAYSVLNDLAGIFRGMACWDGNNVYVVQDSATDPIAVYGNANVIDGSFTYAGVANKAIYTTAEISYSNAQNAYTSDTEYYGNDNAILRYGINAKKLRAFGCTTRSQARRMGMWLVETSILERHTVSFSVGREGLKHTPFDIIQIADNDYAGEQMFARVVEINGSQLTLDREIANTNGAKLLYLTKEGTKSIGISGVHGAVVTLLGTPSGMIKDGGVSITRTDLSPRLYRCTAIAENDDGTYTINAVEHNPNKQAIVDNGVIFDDNNNYTKHKMPTAFGAHVAKSGDDIIVSWDSLTGYGELIYRVEITRGATTYKTLTTKQLQITLSNLPYGEYSAVITATNSAGQVSTPARVSWSVNLTITNLRTVGKAFAVQLMWQNTDMVMTTARIEIWHGTKDDIDLATRVASVSYPTDTYTVGNLELLDGEYYWVRMVDSYGNKGDFTDGVFGKPSDDPSLYAAVLQGAITDTQLHRDLSDKINKTADLAGLVELELAGDTQVFAGNKSRYAGAWSLLSATQEGDYAQAKRTSTLQTKVNDNKSTIQDVAKTVSDFQSATAERITTVQTQVSNNKAIIQQTSSALADTNGKLSALYSVAVVAKSGDGKPIIGGISVGVDGQSASSEILLQADKLMLWDSGKKPMFSTAGGHAVFNGNLIADGSILGRQIAASQQIHSPKVTGGEIIGGSVTGTNINNGNNTFHVDANGNLTAIRAKIQGEVIATSGSFTGDIYANNGYFRGTVYADNMDGSINQVTRSRGSHWVDKQKRIAANDLTIAAKPYERVCQLVNIIATSGVEVRLNGNKQRLNGHASITGYGDQGYDWYMIMPIVFTLPANTVGDIHVTCEGGGKGKSFVNRYEEYYALTFKI